MPTLSAETSETILTISLWGDTVNRIDTLILELRHLQLNLIKVLKVPEFYEALRFEESYLWGEY